MAKNKLKLRTKKTAPAGSPRYVVVSNRSYGNTLKDTKIYYEGKKPKGLNDDGRITFGKHILEAFTRKIKGRFRWIITPTTDSIKIERNIYRIRTSQKTLSQMNDALRDRTRDIKNDIV